MHLCFCSLPVKNKDKRDNHIESINLIDENFHNNYQNEKNKNHHIDQNSHQNYIHRQYSHQLSRQFSRRSSHMIEEDVEKGMQFLIQNKRRKSSCNNSQNQINENQNQNENQNEKDLSSHLYFKNSLTYDQLIIKSLEENVIIERDKEHDNSIENTISPLNSYFVSSKESKSIESKYPSQKKMTQDSL